MNLTLLGFEVDRVVGEDAGEPLGDLAHCHRRDWPGGDHIHAIDSQLLGLPMTPWTNQSMVRIWSRVSFAPSATFTLPDWSFKGPVNW